MSPHYLLIDARAYVTVQSVSHREKLRLSRASGLPYARFSYSTGMKLSRCRVFAR